MAFGINSDSWTILDESGQKAFDFDVFVNLDVRIENKVTSKPVEQGGFTTYNKLVSPTDISLQVAKHGTPSDLQSFEDGLSALAAGTQLVSLITPEQEYKNLNITKLAYRRSSEEGIDIVYIDVGLVEVREVASEYTNVRVATTKKRGKQQTNSETSALAGFFS